MSVPEHVTLAREAQAAGLTVTHLTPANLGDRYDVQLWQADGTLWVEGRWSAAMVRAHINHYPAHRQALTERPGLRLVGSGLVLACGCPTTTDTTEEEEDA